MCMEVAIWGVGCREESFRLAMGAWRVGAGREVPRAERGGRSRKPPLHVAERVVGHDRADGDAERGKPREGVFEKEYGTRGRLIGQEFRIGHAGAIIDRDVEILPAERGLAIPDAALLRHEPPPRPVLADAPEFFDV